MVLWKRIGHSLRLVMWEHNGYSAHSIEQVYTIVVTRPFQPSSMVKGLVLRDYSEGRINVVAIVQLQVCDYMSSLFALKEGLHQCISILL